MSARGDAATLRGRASLRGPARVRRAGPQDAAELAALVGDVYVADGLVPADSPYLVQLRDAARRVAHAHVLVATVPAGDGAEDVVGTITLAAAGTPYAEIATGGEVELRMLVVRPDARGRGLAAELVRAALAEAAATGARRAVLTTLDAMRTAQRLYERLGWVRTPGRDWAVRGLAMLVYTWDVPAAPGALTEAATWPPVRVEHVGPWRAGLSDGLTQRANSVLPLGSPADLAAAVDAVEAVYAAAGRPAVFRVGDPDAAPGLADELDRRGYACGAVTDVLVRDVHHLLDAGVGYGPGALPDAAVALHVADEPDDAWLGTWVGATGGRRDTGRRLLTGAPALYLTAAGADAAPVAIVRVALADGWAALSCLQVAPAARRRGLGTALTVAALRAARDRGARRAFLQVEADNAAARVLYAGLGFAPAHRYAYRRRLVAAGPATC
ncbi:GNAT family N-acetyltransferase [Cellulomonas shaoxiangyii]|uniref:GNAT family N-acetyltransferase n=1 Tax=Cellulomonas shaoxiangyii TaxID=2566013 RepID=A0A4P7SJ09_9CELL|nr:GNAT family N-acetyltransferase [Cellulomonas shaoxiangyii]QCB94229.1 GNAT family N-acetyltransferase [Cellulomonas shaoxiangyii]TGY86722.1 GNAT family N-acetyltransferase [Cellulomonas shaoxiangyii]